MGHEDGAKNETWYDQKPTIDWIARYKILYLRFCFLLTPVDGITNNKEGTRTKSHSQTQAQIPAAA